MCVGEICLYSKVKISEFLVVNFRFLTKMNLVSHDLKLNSMKGLVISCLLNKTAQLLTVFVHAQYSLMCFYRQILQHQTSLCENKKNINTPLVVKSNKNLHPCCSMQRQKDHSPADICQYDKWASLTQSRQPCQHHCISGHNGSQWVQTRGGTNKLTRWVLFNNAVIFRLYLNLLLIFKIWSNCFIFITLITDSKGHGGNNDVILFFSIFE